ncbi:hypothetical protein Misp03_55810 [Microbispora sp. NBRC 16548]|nr:hypothetical protein Misp03_55810 [Microbispora sp. NBRC 16548]
MTPGDGTGGSIIDCRPGCNRRTIDRHPLFALVVPHAGGRSAPMFAAVGLVVLMILTGVLYEMAVHNRPRRRK